MFKLLIVDDETETRQGIRQHMPWDKLDIGEVKIARNGEEAIKLSSEFAPDIVVSDIRMPNMNGIEFCTVLRSLLPYCQIIFISAYVDKDYLKAAIELDAVSFVEKPINLKELEHAIGKATANLRMMITRHDETRAYAISMPVLRELTIFNIVSGHTRKTPKEALEAAGLFQHGELYFRVFLFKFSGALPVKTPFENRLNDMLRKFAGNNEFIVAFRENKQAVAVMAAREKHKFDELCWRFFEQEVRFTDIQGFRLFCSIGKCEAGADDIAASYRQAVMASQKLFSTGYGATVYYRTEEEDDALQSMSARLSTIEDLIAEKRLEDLLKELNSLYSYLKGKPRLSVVQVKNHYLHITYMIAHKSPMRITAGTSDGDISDYSPMAIHEMETLEEVHNYTCNLTREKFSAPEYSSIVLDTIRRIEKRHGEVNLKIKQLAEAAFVTPSYLSRVFKDETQKTILQYITDVRIKHAKQLLCDKELKLYHIAVMVGYDNPSYFAKVFKKEIGDMPSKYREHIK